MLATPAPELPVVIINELYHGSDFVDFITSPKLGECVVFLDEFEKIYSKQEFQHELLSIMDGNYATKLIFLLTVNEVNAIKSCMKSYVLTEDRVKDYKHHIPI